MTNELPAIDFERIMKRNQFNKYSEDSIFQPITELVQCFSNCKLVRPDLDKKDAIND